MFSVSNTWITPRTRQPFDCTQTPSHYILLYTPILSFLSSCTQTPSCFTGFYTTVLSFYSIFHIHPLIPLSCSFCLRISPYCTHPSSHFQACVAKLWKATVSSDLCVCLSVRLSVHMEKSRLLLDGLSWKFIFEDF